MMHKIIPAASWDFGDAISAIVKVASGGRLLGSDRTALIKRASEEFAHQIRHLAWEDGLLPVHTIAMGATERYGANRNGDGFKSAALQKYHPLFVQHAKCFRDHQNKPHSPFYGVIKASYYNPRMHRVELLAGYFQDEKTAEKYGGRVADRELQRLESGDDLSGSMACFTDPTFPILTRDRGYVGIRDVRENDWVYTKEGRWRRVTKLNRRRYTGKVYKFRLQGLPLEMELTADHPLWAKTFAGSRQASAITAKAARYFRDPKAFEQESADWHHACHLHAGDRLFYRPVSRYASYGRITCPQLAALMGYFVAEGSFSYNNDKACTVQYSCNLDDSAPRRIPQIVEQLFPDLLVDIQPHHESEAGLTVSIHHTALAEMFRRYLGKGCRGKYVPPEIFNAADDVKLSFLGAWLDGDGWLDKKGLHWSTASINLVLQGRDLLAALGIPASVYQIDHSRCPSSGHPGSGIEYTLNVSHLDGWRLAGWSGKVAGYEAPALSRKQPASMRLCPDGNYALRIKTVTVREVTDLETYNFEVDEDESYSAAGLISHNCKVAYDVCASCGNKARNRGEYCDEFSCVGPRGEKRGGCKQHLAKVASDGFMNHVDNPHPWFFDWSSVGTPAERTAYGNVADYLLQKAAAADQVLSGAELAELYDVTSGGLYVPAGYEPAVERQRELAYKLAEAEQLLETSNQPLAADDLVRAVDPAMQSPVDLAVLGPAGSTKLATGLAALARQQVVLPLRDFVRLETGSDSAKSAALADRVAHALPGIYGRLIADDDLDQQLRSNPYQPARELASLAQRQWADKLAAEYGWSRTAVQQRIWRSRIHDRTVPTLEPTLSKQAAASDPEAASLAKRYALYKLAFLAAQAEDLPLTEALALRQNYVAAG